MTAGKYGDTMSNGTGIIYCSIIQNNYRVNVLVQSLYCEYFKGQYASLLSLQLTFQKNS